MSWRNICKICPNHTPNLDDMKCVLYDLEEMIKDNEDKENIIPLVDV